MWAPFPLVLRGRAGDGVIKQGKGEGPGMGLGYLERGWSTVRGRAVDRVELFIYLKFPSNNSYFEIIFVYISFHP